MRYIGCIVKNVSAVWRKPGVLRASAAAPPREGSTPVSCGATHRSIVCLVMYSNGTTSS